METQENVYREAAVERLSSPEELDELLSVTRTRGWLILGATSVLLVAVLVWGVVGTVTSTVQAEGVLMRRGGVSELRAESEGRIELHAAVGEVVAVDQSIATIHPPKSAGGEAEELTLPFAARVLAHLVEDGQVLGIGTPMLSVERANETLTAVVFVSPAIAHQLRPGMAARIAPRGLAPERHGYLVGRVARVDRHATSRRALEHLLDDETRATDFADRDLRLRLDVALERDPTAESGLRRSIPADPLPPFGSGTDVVAQIVVRQDRPLAQVIPWLNAGERR